jgi:hypothetical protein
MASLLGMSFVAFLVLHAGMAVAANAPEPGPRQLISIAAQAHDPLFVDAQSIQRRGRQVHFKYLLDVLAPDENGIPNVWRSNEIEASIDCSRREVTVRRLVAYSDRRGGGAPTAVHSFTAPGAKPQPIAPKSTFAYLEAHLCAPA